MENLNLPQIINLIAMTYFATASLYILFFALAAYAYRRQPHAAIPELKSVWVLIPAYKEDNVIVETVTSALKHFSKYCSFDVGVVADSLKPETLEALRNTKVKIIQASFEKSTKTKSINLALAQNTELYDWVVLLDADNIMAPGFLDNIAVHMAHGKLIVQGQRTAKNNNTPFAMLDGISEAVNNSIFRKGHSAVGLSTALIGSGFACEYAIFKQIMLNIQAIGGFDKELELELLSRKIRIAYAPDAIIYDEKIQQSEAFFNQRRRWISSQFIFLFKNIGKGINQLLTHSNIDYFDKLFQYALPPRVLSLGLPLLFASTSVLLHVLFPQYVSINYFVAWFSIFIATSAAIVLSIPRRYFTTDLFSALLALPLAFLLMLKALLKAKGANKTFIHTQHGIR